MTILRIAGLVVVLMFAAGSLGAAELNDNSVIRKDDPIITENDDAIVSTTASSEVNELDGHELEMMTLEILGRWKDMDLLEKAAAIVGLISWVGGWAAFIGLAIAGGPVGWIVLGVVLFYLLNFAGPICVYNILV